MRVFPVLRSSQSLPILRRSLQNAKSMSLLVLHKPKLRQYVLVPFKRPKGDSLHYASGPIETVNEIDIDDYLLKWLEVERIETREGIRRELILPYPLAAEDEKKLLT